MSRLFETVGKSIQKKIETGIVSHLNNATNSNLIVATACNIVNRLTDSIDGYNSSKIDVNSIFDSATDTKDLYKKTSDCSTSEEFVSTVKSIIENETKVALEKFASFSSNALKEIRMHNIPKDQCENISKMLNACAKKCISEIRDMNTDVLMFSKGFSLENVPEKDHINCISYVKQSMQEMVEDLAKALVDEICEGSSLTIKPNENQIQQQMATPMVQMGTGFNPIPNFSNDPDISRHFVIGNNVAIYDPNQQEMFRSLLKSLAQQLDQKDKEAGLTEPSKFGFSQFYNIGQFVAVRLNSENCFIPVEDTDNFMCIVMENGNVSLTMPSKAA